MLTLLTGTPGSGKTLYAVDKIIKISSKELEEFKNIEFIYNNISGFKFDKFNDSDIKIYKFVFQDFYVHLQILYKMFILNEHNQNLDDLLQKYCKENNLLNAYFIIDEAHNYFDNQDKAKNWWFTYHRHLHHEILLITQNKSLINTQYRNIPELFIKAQPISKAISKNTMRYFNYTDYRMINKFSTTEIKINDTYFSIYKSGNVSNQKLAGLKYIKMFVIFVLTLILCFGFLIYKFYFASTAPISQEITKDDKNITKQNQTNLSAPINLPQNKSLPIPIQKNNSKLFKFTCFSTFCYLDKDLITDKNYEIPFEILRNLIKDIKSENLYFYQRDKKMVIYILDDAEKFNFITGVRNEENVQRIKDINNNLNMFNQPKG